MMTEAQQQIIGRLEQQRHALMLRAEAANDRRGKWSRVDEAIRQRIRGAST
jgi:hypothetical protein